MAQPGCDPALVFGGLSAGFFVFADVGDGAKPVADVFAEGDQVECGVDAAFVAADDGEGVAIEGGPIGDARAVEGVFGTGEGAVAWVEKLAGGPDDEFGMDGAGGAFDGKSTLI